MEDVLNAISTVGFPIAVATYCLIRLETAVKANTKVLNAMYTRLTGEIPKEDKDNA